MTIDDGTGVAPEPRPAPSTAELRLLVDKARYAEAAALLEGVDLTQLGAEARYLAGVCLGSDGNFELAIELLKGAAADGFPPFWCAYHLGLFEMKRGRKAAAAYYLTVSLILDPGRTDLLPLLANAAPDIDLGPLEAVQAGTRSAEAARAALDSAWAALHAGHSGSAVFYCTTCVALDPEDQTTRARLLKLAPDIRLDLMPQPRRTAGSSSGVAAARKAPAPRELQELVNGGRYDEAASLLEGVDLGSERNADILYHAGVCFSAVGREEEALDLLKRAAAGGFSGFWCAYHLGLAEMKRGRAVHAAYYLSASLILDPARADLLALLDKVAPEG